MRALEGCDFRASGNGGSGSPCRAASPRYRLIVFVVRLRLGERVVRMALLVIESLLGEVFIPLRRSPGGCDSRRGGGLADVSKDGPNIDRFRAMKARIRISAPHFGQVRGNAS